MAATYQNMSYNDIRQISQFSNVKPGDNRVLWGVNGNQYDNPDVTNWKWLCNAIDIYWGKPSLNTTGDVTSVQSKQITTTTDLLKFIETTAQAVNNKVDKVDGKGLSTNDFKVIELSDYINSDDDELPEDDNLIYTYYGQVVEKRMCQIDSDNDAFLFIINRDVTDKEMDKLTVLAFIQSGGGDYPYEYDDTYYTNSEDCPKWVKAACGLTYATTDNDGLMSAEDKSKLDSLSGDEIDSSAVIKVEIPKERDESVDLPENGYVFTWNGEVTEYRDMYWSDESETKMIVFVARQHPLESGNSKLGKIWTAIVCNYDNDSNTISYNNEYTDPDIPDNILALFNEKEATITRSGLMSSSDKEKLDNIGIPVENYRTEGGILPVSNVYTYQNNPITPIVVREDRALGGSTKLYFPIYKAEYSFEPYTEKLEYYVFEYRSGYGVETGYYYIGTEDNLPNWVAKQNAVKLPIIVDINEYKTKDARLPIGDGYIYYDSSLGDGKYINLERISLAYSDEDGHIEGSRGSDNGPFYIFRNNVGQDDESFDVWDRFGRYHGHWDEYYGYQSPNDYTQDDNIDYIDAYSDDEHPIDVIGYIKEILCENLVSENKDGLMSSSDKQKLDGAATIVDLKNYKNENEDISVLPLNGCYVYLGQPVHSMKLWYNDDELECLAFCIYHDDDDDDLDSSSSNHKIMYYTRPRGEDNYVYRRTFTTNNTANDLEKEIANAFCCESYISFIDANKNAQFWPVSTYSNYITQHEIDQDKIHIYWQDEKYILYIIDPVETPDADTLYCILKTNNIYRCVKVKTYASESDSGLMSAEDKRKLDVMYQYGRTQGWWN